MFNPYTGTHSSVEIPNTLVSASSQASAAVLPLPSLVPVVTPNEEQLHWKVFLQEDIDPIMATTAIEIRIFFILL